MKKKLIIAAVLSFGLGITAANAANSPTFVVDVKYFEKHEGLYKYCDNSNLVYVYREYGGRTGNSLQVSMTVIPRVC